MAMETDDLDNLIADSLGGVQSAMEGERKPTAPAPAAGEAVKELHQGPAKPSGGAEVPDEEFFANLVNMFSDEKFQKAMADAMQAMPVAEGAAPSSSAGTAPAAAAAPAPASSDAGVEEYLQNFMHSFEQAVGNDGDFEKNLGTLMTSMLPKDLILKPYQTSADNLEAWMAKQKGLAPSERSRYEKQLKTYRAIIGIYTTRPDPLPDDAREDVTRLLTELHQLGDLPEEVKNQMGHEEAADGEQSFQDFASSMGLDQGLGSAEQDLLKKLSEDPEELTKVMKEIGEGNLEECKQQ